MLAGGNSASGYLLGAGVDCTDEMMSGRLRW